MQLIDLDVYHEEEVVLTFAAPPNGLGFVVIDPVPYETHGGWSREEPGLSLDLWFAQPASLELWLGDRGNRPRDRGASRPVQPDVTPSGNVTLQPASLRVFRSL